MNARAMGMKGGPCIANTIIAATITRNSAIGRDPKCLLIFFIIGNIALFLDFKVYIHPSSNVYDLKTDDSNPSIERRR